MMGLLESNSIGFNFTSGMSFSLFGLLTLCRGRRHEPRILRLIFENVQFGFSQKLHGRVAESCSLLHQSQSRRTITQSRIRSGGDCEVMWVVPILSQSKLDMARGHRPLS